MSIAGTQARLATVPPAQGFIGALRAASRRITWQVVAVTIAIAAGLELYAIFEFSFDGANPGDGTPPPAIKVYASGAIITLAMAFSIMFATRVADERVARGAKRWLAYTWAVVCGSAAGALLQGVLHQALHIPNRYNGIGVPHDISVMQPAVVFFEYVIWGSIAVFIYVNRRTALLASARMHLAQTEQARARRRTLESRLQALQARVEPQFLFNTLAKVRALYEEDQQKGAELLEDLIVYLRAALPHLRESTSTLERELRLVTAYLSIMRTHLGDRLDFAIDALPERVDHSAKMPPMILLPLVDCLLAGSAPEAAARREVRLVAHVLGDRLVVEIGVPGRDPGAADPHDVLPDICERLRALYGDAVRLDVESESSVRPGTRVVMEIPYESADGDHR